MINRDIIIESRYDPNGLPMSKLASPELSHAICGLADQVMLGDGVDMSFRGIAVRGNSSTGNLVQVSTGLLVERYSAEHSPSGLLQVSGRAILVFASREGFGVALTDSIVAESPNGELAVLKVRRPEDQIALGMVSMSAFSVGDANLPPFVVD